MFCSFRAVCVGGSAVDTRGAAVSRGPYFLIFAVKWSGRERGIERRKCE